MKSIKILLGLICFVFLTSFNTPKTSDEYDIEAFYKGLTPSSGTMILTSSDELEEAELILVPTNIENGKYLINVTRKTSDLYKIDGKNIYIKMPPRYGKSNLWTSKLKRLRCFRQKPERSQLFPAVVESFIRKSEKRCILSCIMTIPLKYSTKPVQTNSKR